MNNNYVWENSSLVWLKIPGGISGWNVNDFNKYIDKWNNEIRYFIESEPAHKENDPYYISPFFDWFNYETKGNYYHVFSCENPKLKTIKAPCGKGK